MGARGWALMTNNAGSVPIAKCVRTIPEQSLFAPRSVVSVLWIYDWTQLLKPEPWQTNEISANRTTSCNEDFIDESVPFLTSLGPT